MVQPLRSLFIFKENVGTSFATTADDSTLVSNYAADPAIIVYRSFGARSLNSKNILLGLQVTLEYDVEFFSNDGVSS